MREIRFETALATARVILAAAGAPATPDMLSCTTYAVLSAIYESESRLAGEPAPVLCPGCVRALHAWLGDRRNPS